MFDLMIVIYEYTEILLGMRHGYSMKFFEMSDKSNEKAAMDMIRFVAKVFLRCNDWEIAKNTLTPEVMEKMQLTRIMRYINIPSAVDPSDRAQYVIDRTFSAKFDEETWVANHLCERMMRGTLKKFPKFYMAESEGLKRSAYCLRYFLTREKPLMSVADLYRYSMTQDFRAYLKSHLLYNACEKLYASPVDYVHAAMGEDRADDLLFILYKTLFLLDPERKISLKPRSLETETMSWERLAREADAANKREAGKAEPLVIAEPGI